MLIKSLIAMIIVGNLIYAYQCIFQTQKYIEEILINNRCVEEARLWDPGLRLLFLSPAMLTNTTQ